MIGIFFNFAKFLLRKLKTILAVSRFEKSFKTPILTFNCCFREPLKNGIIQARIDPYYSKQMFFYPFPF